MRRRGARVAFIVLAMALVVGLGSVLIGAAGAVSPCANSMSTPNALATTNASGTVVHGSACADRIVVTSPLVKEVVGGEGNDLIYANPDVEVVEGGAGDDTIYGDLPESVTNEESPNYVPTYAPAPPATPSSEAKMSLELKKCEAGVNCYGGDGSQELIGSSGADKIFGQRGNDLIKGNAGNDELFGGVGDEVERTIEGKKYVGISGGEGNDLLSGGLGTDVMNGDEGNDTVRGDGTIDTIEGGAGTDTLSFASGVTPGFHGTVSISGFPADSESEERGVYVRLDGVEGLCGSYQACNNDATNGGGSDEIVASGFENVIGSPFDDYIVGSSGANKLYGGGGADVIWGQGGNDELFGGADGDYMNGGEGTDTADGEKGQNNCLEIETRVNCLGSEEKVVQRDRSKIAVGLMVTNPEAPLNWSEAYMTGSEGIDHVKASLSGSTVTFTAEGESAQFDSSEFSHSQGCTYEATKVQCTVTKLDSIVLAGMKGNDTITTEALPVTSTPILLGGEGNDTLNSSNGTEDMLVDGPGNDSLSSGNFDDALINNQGKDVLEGGLGNDLLLSAVNCEGDTIDGAKASEGDAGDVNNASWAKLPVGSGLVANLESGKAGSEAGPACPGGAEVTKLLRIDDLEGSNGVDKLVGDGNANNILGHKGNDELLGQAGTDNIEAAEGEGALDTDKVGGGAPSTKPGDSCSYDAVDSVTGCES